MNEKKKWKKKKNEEKMLISKTIKYNIYMIEKGMREGDKIIEIIVIEE